MNILEGDKPIVSVGLETRRVISKGDQAGKSHIKIWVTFIVRENGEKKWKRRPYKTGLFCTDVEFERIKDAEKNNRRLPTELHDIAIKLDEFKVKARDVIKAGFIDEKAFESRFLSKYVLEDIAAEYQLKIDELRRAKPRPKISSAENYDTSLKSLQEFFGESVLITFYMISQEKLQEYEDWYIGLGKSMTSVGFNLRCLRHIFKRAIKRGIIPATVYPFGVGQYVIPEGGGDTKQFLESEEKFHFVNWRHKEDQVTVENIIKDYLSNFKRKANIAYPDFKEWSKSQKEELFERFAMEVIERRNELHDYTLFSYYGFGMNISDIARLRKNQVFKEYIQFDRQKTKGKKKKSKITIIPLHPEMRAIIKRRGQKSLVPDDYVFPILNTKLTEEAIFYKIRHLVDEINATLAIVAKDGKFETKLTSYTLRHTFAFNFMQLGASTEELQDALAHGSKQTTENYKHGFGLEKKKKFSEGL